MLSSEVEVGSCTQLPYVYRSRRCSERINLPHHDVTVLHVPNSASESNLLLLRELYFRLSNDSTAKICLLGTLMVTSSFSLALNDLDPPSSPDASDGFKWFLLLSLSIAIISYIWSRNTNQDAGAFS